MGTPPGWPGQQVGPGKDGPTDAPALVLTSSNALVLFILLISERRRAEAAGQSPKQTPGSRGARHGARCRRRAGPWRPRPVLRGRGSATARASRDAARAAAALRRCHRIAWSWGRRRPLSAFPLSSRNPAARTCLCLAVPGRVCPGAGARRRPTARVSAHPRTRLDAPRGVGYEPRGRGCPGACRPHEPERPRWGFPTHPEAFGDARRVLASLHPARRPVSRVSGEKLVRFTNKSDFDVARSGSVGSRTRAATVSRPRARPCPRGGPGGANPLPAAARGNPRRLPHRCGACPGGPGGQVQGPAAPG